MAITQVPQLVQQKLEAFERIQPHFEQAFRFTQEVHGQKRHSSFSVEQIVFYLHSLWLCECKDRLLSVYKNIHRYEGLRCLALLSEWQSGRCAGVVQFLQEKLDLATLAQTTAQIEALQDQQKDIVLKRLLERGRLLQLNRATTLTLALGTISSLSQEGILAEVGPACAHYGHTQAQIAAQQMEIASPIYAFRPHSALAQRNMTLMNQLNIEVFEQIEEPPRPHFWQRNTSPQAAGPFASLVIDGYQPNDMA